MEIQMQEVTKLSPYCAKLFSDLNPFNANG